MGVLARRLDRDGSVQAFFFPGSRKGRTLEYAFKTLVPTLLKTCFWVFFPFVSVLIKFGSPPFTTFSLNMGWHWVTRADLELTL